MPRTLTRSAFPLICLLLTIVSHTRHAVAQCETEWMLGQPSPGLITNTGDCVRAVLARDPDGPGPLPEQLWVGGDFTSIDGSNDISLRSLAWWDGSRWQTPPSGNLTYVHSLAEYNGQLAVGGVGANAVRLFDGTTWTTIATFGTSTPITALEVHNGDLYAAGPFQGIGGAPNTKGIARWNGTGWSALGSGLPSGGIVTAMKSTPTGLVVVGNFDTMSGYTTQDAARWDGTFWHVMNGFPGGSAWPLSLTMHEGTLFAGLGVNPGSVLYAWDGTSWQPHTPVAQLSGNVSALHSFGGSLFAMGGPLSVGGAPARENVARWDGTFWSRCNDPHLPFAISGDRIGPAATFGNSMVIGGNPKINVGTHTFSSMVMWNESDGWSTFAKGFDGNVANFLEYQGSWYVCGSFRMAGGKACHGVARFDGQTFRPVGSGLLVSNSFSSWVDELAEFQGTLYACGQQLSVGWPIAKWNGTAWVTAHTPSSTSVGGRIISMAANEDAIMATSPFSSVYRFDGSAWSQALTGFTFSAFCVAEHQGDLYVGGPTTFDGGIRRWIQGTQWEPVSTGPVKIQRMLSHDGKLFALGLPIFGGNTPGPNTSIIAEVQGTSIVPVGPGGGMRDNTDGFFGGLASYHGSFIATNNYYRSEPTPRRFGNVIRFDGLNWLAVNPEVFEASPSQRPYVAKVHNDTLWLGGSFLQMNGQSSPYIARYRTSPAPTFATTPTAATIRAGQSTSFSATRTNQTPVQQRWRRNSVALVEGAALPGGGIALGVDTETLTIAGAQASDSGDIDCLITNACGTTITPAVALVVFCTADFDDDGDPAVANPDLAVTIEDLLFFIVAFEAGNVAVDIDNGTFTGVPDQAVTVDDLLYFLDRFEAGC